jgi:hypothetical protein
MDPVTLITTALIVGATAALQETAGQAVKDAYNGFKSFLVGRFQSTKSAVDSLEEDLTDEPTQNALTSRLTKAAVASDDEVLRRAQELVEAVKRYAPQVGAQLNIDLNDLIVGGSATFRNVEKTVKGRNWNVTGDLTVENVGMRGDDAPNA